MEIISISAKVIPKSKKTSIEILEVTSGKIFLRIKVRARPEDGKANEELICTLADYFGIPKSEITLKSGYTSKSKLLLARGVDITKVSRQLPLC
jgi:uncharacterized protein (TIGR00251 family)